MNEVSSAYMRLAVTLPHSPAIGLAAFSGSVFQPVPCKYLR